MWTWLASFLSGPVINGLIGAYKAKLQAGNTSDKIAADLAQRELMVQQVELQAQAQLKIAEIGHWYEPEKLFAYIMVVFMAKVVVWDKVLGLGTTDAITGDVGQWAGWIMAFYMGKRGVENVIRIAKR